MRTVVIDPGHGGIDRNGLYTTAPNKMFRFPDGTTLYEGVINRQVAGLLYHLLDTYPNIRPVFTVNPHDPRDISLRQRVKVANSYHDSILISIHHNAGGGSGAEIFTNPGQTSSDRLATMIFDQLSPIYSKYSLPMRPDHSDGDPDKESAFYVLRKTKGVAVLLEYGFFDSERDRKLITDANFQKKVAYATFQAIKKFVELQR